MNGRILPSPRQLAYMDLEFGMFFHFGIRSFFRGHQDWDKKPMPAIAFNPMHLLRSMDTEKQGRRRELRTIDGKAPRRLLPVAVGMHGVFGEKFPMERWERRCGGRVYRSVP